MYFLVNEYPPKPLDVTTGAYVIRCGWYLATFCVTLIPGQGQIIYFLVNASP